MAQCSYLGHVVSQGRVAPEACKVEALQAFAQPKTKKDIRAFVGLVGYYRRFIPAFAELTAGLTDLTRAAAPNLVQWTPELQTAFTRLRKELSRGPTLQTSDFGSHFYLQTDASERGIGAVLSQFNTMGEEHPVAYISRKLLPRG